jgi:hypothetical protein
MYFLDHLSALTTNNASNRGLIIMNFNGKFASETVYYIFSRP